MARPSEYERTETSCSVTRVRGELRGRGRGGRRKEDEAGERPSSNELKQRAPQEQGA